MDRILVAGAFFLLLFEISLLVSDFDGRSAAQALRQGNTHSAPMVGEMLKAENLVRRRGQSSLTWDESRNQDSLFESDSVLTLAGSSAQIRLGTQTTLNLDENTLLVLESNDTTSNGSIRIRFARGNMRARNNGQALEVDGGAWTLEAEQGSVVSLVSLTDGKFGVEVEEGEAQVASPKGKESVIKGESAVIHETGVQERKKISSTLKWEPRIPKRVYSRTFPVSFDLDWRGTPDRLEIIDPTRTSTKISQPESNGRILSLTEGTYILRLEEGEQISEALAVQIRRAPEIRYFTPLPRDRVPFGSSTLFAWEPVPGAKGYRLEISTQIDFSDQLERFDTKEPRLSTVLKTEGSYHWRVIAIDAEGWPIPAPRSYPLFAIPQPLQAPQLNPPVIRSPAADESESELESSDDRTSRLFFELLTDFALPKANAQSVEPKEPTGRLEAVFTWAEVPGAEHYLIEISKNPTFNDPIAIERVKDPKFILKGAQPGVYFWRVAAGRMITVGNTSTEQIGLFSPPTLVRLEQAPPPPPVGPKMTEVLAQAPTIPSPSPTPDVALEPTPNPLDPSAETLTATEASQEETEVPVSALSPSFKPLAPPPSPTPLNSKTKTREDRLAENAVKARIAKLEEEARKERLARAEKRTSPQEEIVALPPKITKKVIVEPKAQILEHETSPVVANDPRPVKELEPPPEPSRALSGRFWLTPGYRLTQTKNEQEIEGSFKGFVPIGVDGEFVLPFTSRFDLELLMSYSEVKWQPQGAQSEQSELKENRYGLDLALRPLAKSWGMHWSFGVGAEVLPLFSRTQAEAGEFKDQWLYGPTVRFNWASNSFDSEVRLSPRFGEGLTGGKLATHWVYHFYKAERFKGSLGPAFSSSYFSGSGGRSITDIDLGLRLGISW